MAFVVGIEVTRRCNFRCRHCFVDAGRPRRHEASTDQTLAILAELATLGTTVIAWSGGEPLLRQDLERLTSAATGLGMQVGLVSNGFLASAERMASLRKAGLGVVQVSLDGSTPVRASRFRQGPRAAFDRAVEAIRNSIAAGMQTYVCTLLAPETAGEIDDMIRLSRSLGAHGLRYTMWMPVGRAGGAGYRERNWASPAVGRFLDVLAREDRRDGFRVLMDCPTGPLPHRPYLDCTAGTHTVYITSDGNVYPCTALMTPAYRLGNLRRTPLPALLASPRTRRIHEQRAQLKPRGTCAGCSTWDACHGGCPGRTVAVDGSLVHGSLQGAMPTCLLRLHGRA
jgi:radical SAM protein with 4Fe4S-binding SPASM domain